MNNVCKFLDNIDIPMKSLFLPSAVAVCYEFSFVYHLFVRDRYQNYIIYCFSTVDI